MLILLVVLVNRIKINFIKKKQKNKKKTVPFVDLDKIILDGDWPHNFTVRI